MSLGTNQLYKWLVLSYDLAGNLTAITYPDDTQDTFTYDALNRLVLSQPRQGCSTAYTYNAMGDVLTVTVGERTTAYEYDLLGRTVAVISPDGARTECEYDALGNLVNATDALGNKTAYEYAPGGALAAITYANGSKVTAEYDLAGNLIAETDPEGARTAYAYDAVNRLTAVTDALGGVTRYRYDAADNLAAVVDALGHETSYTYDKNGNLTSETDALGNTTSYTYTPEGWLAAATDANGQTTRYSYDQTGTLTAESAPGESRSNSYNKIGLVTSVTTDEGVTEYQFDDRGYLLSVTEPNGSTVSYTYDDYGNRSSLTYPDGKTVTYSYDSMNRLTAVTGADGKKMSYAYDLLGQRISTDGEKEDTSYTYDAVGNVVSQITTGKYDVSLAYTYDFSGRMISESRTENGAAVESSYIYDALGQITEFTRSDGVSESYTYDPAGNMLSKTAGSVKTRYSYNAANQLVSDGTFDYTYDKVGNLLKKQSDGGSVSYTYNARNLLESWTDGEHSESYRYNASGLLSTVTTDASTTALTWDTLYGDGVVISADTDGEVTDFTYGLERISAVTGKSRTEYVYDARGSVIAEVSKAGLLSGTKVTTKSYTPFGEQIGEQTSGFGWNGEYYNAATGMVYFRARFYEPEMNRFSQKDILRGSIINPQTLNRYVYCINDPVNFIDPSGMRLVENDPREVRSDLIVPTGRAGTSGPSTNTNVSAKSAAQTAQNVRVQNRLDELDERVDNSGSSENNGKTNPNTNPPTVDTEDAVAICNSEEEDKWTTGVGTDLAAAFGIRISGGTQIVFDSHGEIGIMIYGGFGGGTPTASLSATATYIPNVDIYDLKGWSTADGLGVLPIPIGTEATVADGNIGTTFSYGLAATPWPEAHGEIIYAEVIPITEALKNFGIYDEIYYKARQLTEEADCDY